MVVVAVIGTDEDPQDLEAQLEAFRGAGAHAFPSLRQAVEHCLHLLPPAPTTSTESPAVSAADLAGLINAWNVGLESLYDSLVLQESKALHIERRPPAGGNEELAALLRKMKPRP